MRKETNREGLKTDFEFIEGYAKSKNEFTRIKIFGGDEIVDFMYNRQGKYFEKIVWTYFMNRCSWDGSKYESHFAFKDIIAIVESIKNPKIIIDTIPSLDVKLHRDNTPKKKNPFRLPIMPSLARDIRRCFSKRSHQYWNSPLDEEDKIEIDNLVEEENWQKIFTLALTDDRYMDGMEGLPDVADITKVYEDWGIDYLKDQEEIYFYQYWKRKDLTEFKVPEGITGICNGAFARCTKLASIELPETLEYIYIDAFYKCIKLESITLPRSLKSLGACGGWFGDECVFYGCKKLKDIYYKGTKEEWAKIDTKITYPEEKINDNIFYGCPAEVIHCIDGDIKIKEENK